MNDAAPRSHRFARAVIALGMVGLLIMLVKPRRRQSLDAVATMPQGTPHSLTLSPTPAGREGEALFSQTISVGKAHTHPRAALVGWMMMAVSAFFFRPHGTPITIALNVGALSFLRADQLSIDPLVLAALSFLMGTLLLAQAYQQATFLPKPVSPEGGRGVGGEGYHPRALPLALGIALLAALVWVNHAPAEVNVSLHVQVFLLMAGIVFGVWGVGGELSPHPKSLSLRARDLLPFSLREKETGDEGKIAPLLSGEALLLGGIVLLALVVRVWALDTAVRAWVDEILLSTPVTRLVHGEPTRLLHPMGEYMPYPYLFPYAQWWTVEAFGRSYVGLRLVSALVGALTIPALYLLARTLFDRTTALAAAAVLATFPPHLHFSRIAVINIADPLVGTLMLAFLARGLNSNRRLDFALAGAALGMTQYFYEGGRLFYPALALAWLVGLHLFGMRRWSSETRRGLATLVIAALLVAAPLLVSNALLADSPRYRASWALRDLGYWTHLFEGDNFVNHLRVTADTFLVYVHETDISGFYGGDTPLVIAPIVPALLVGVALTLIALRRSKAARALLALLWLALTSLGNTLLLEYTGAARYVVGFPALALLIAVGLRYGVDLLLPAPPGTQVPGYRNAKFTEVDSHPLVAPVQVRRADLLLALAVAAVMVMQVGYYFGTHVRVYNLQVNSAPSPNGVDALWRAQDFPPGTQVHLVSGWTPFIPQFGEDLMRYIADGIQLRILQTKDFTRAYVEALPRDVDQAFFLEASDIASYWLVRETFGELPPQFTPYDIPANKSFVLYYAPRARD